MSSSTALATFGGMASGLPVQQLIDATIAANSSRLNKYKEDKDTAAKQQTAYNTVKAKFNSFDSTLQKVIDSRMIFAFDLFDRKKAESSDSSVATVATSKGAMTGNVEIQVNSLAKPAQINIPNMGGAITPNVNLLEVGVIEGDFALAFQTPSGGVTISSTIFSGDTLASYVAKLNQKIADSGTLSGSIAVTVDSNGVSSLDCSGVTGGTLNSQNPFSHSRSNFADVFGLKFDATDPNKLVGVPKSTLNLDGKISDNSAGFRNLGPQTLPETINIGGVKIEVTTDTTFRQIMNKVNENASCQVKMAFDTTSNSLSIRAKDDFYSDNIFFSGKTLLSDLGLTDANGVVNNTIQTKRTPGEIEIAGKKIAIKSNKVTAAETGLTGVTINLKAVTKTDEPLKVSISDNTDDLTNALNDVVGAFNAIAKTLNDYTFVKVDTTDTKATAEKGVLAGDYTLTSMKTSLQMQLMTPLTENLSYKALAVVGFSTEDGQIKFDKAKFLNALSDNPEDIKKMFVGNKDEGTVGIFGAVQKQLKQYTDVQSGFFVTKANSLTSSMTALNKSITDEQSRLDQQRTRLVKQYSDLDSTVSKYQSQMSSFSSS